MRCAFANKADAQAIDHPLQSQLLGIFNFLQYIFRRLVAHALEAEQLAFRQLVNVGNIFHHALVCELRDQRVAHAVNVHHSPRGEMQNRLSQFGRTLLVHAAMIGFTLGPYHMATADRAALGHFKRLAPARMIFVVENPCDLWNHVAATFDFHPVANLHP